MTELTTTTTALKPALMPAILRTIGGVLRNLADLFYAWADIAEEAGRSYTNGHN